MAYTTDTPERKKKAALYMRDYYHKNPKYRASVIARSRARELANPEEKLKKSRIYHEQHKKAINEKGALRQKTRRKNPEILAKDRAYLKRWRLNNKSKIAAHQQTWREKNRIELRLKSRGRLARCSNIIAKEDIPNWQSRICGICNRLIEGSFHIDHRIPLSKGGLHEISNLQLAHPTCNLKKKDKLYFTI